MSERVTYDAIPQTMRDLLDEVYDREGVEIWWNARQRMWGVSAATEWQTVEGRERVRQWVDYLAGGAW